MNFEPLNRKLRFVVSNEIKPVINTGFDRTMMTHARSHLFRRPFVRSPLDLLWFRHNHLWGKEERERTVKGKKEWKGKRREGRKDSKGWAVERKHLQVQGHGNVHTRTRTHAARTLGRIHASSLFRIPCARESSRSEIASSFAQSDRERTEQEKKKWDSMRSSRGKCYQVFMHCRRISLKTTLMRRSGYPSLEGPPTAIVNLIEYLKANMEIDLWHSLWSVYPR